MTELKDVHDFWNRGSCGEVYAGQGTDQERYAQVSKLRYELEPYLCPFARFEEAQDKDVLEIGVGMGSDHQKLAEASPRSLRGLDLTDRALEHTRQRFQAFGLNSELASGNAEKLTFADNSFDFVYSWGVIHHSPDTPQAAREILRVLRPGGVARVMIYHRRSAGCSGRVTPSCAASLGSGWMRSTPATLNRPALRPTAPRKAGHSSPGRRAWPPS
jgi:SAM-dependent methyltransferase